MLCAPLPSPDIAKASATGTRLLRPCARLELAVASSRALEVFPTAACVRAQFALVSAGGFRESQAVAHLHRALYEFFSLLHLPVRRGRARCLSALAR